MQLHSTAFVLRCCPSFSCPAFSVNSPVSLVIEDNKRPDGTTFLPWTRRKPLAWDMTLPDTYVESYINDTMTSPGLTADQAAQQKMDKYSKHTFLRASAMLKHVLAIGWTSVRLSVCQTLVLYQNGWIYYCHAFFTTRQPIHSSFVCIKIFAKFRRGHPLRGR